MKKYLILFIATVSMSFAVGCSSDDNLEGGLNFVTFEADELGFGVQEAGTGSLEVTVFTGNVTGSDRTFAINVDESSTLNSETYTVPATVTIPGGSNESTFVVEGTDTNLPNSGGSLILNLENEEGLYTGDPLTINVSRICPFDPAGSYIDTSGYFGAEFPAEIVAGAAAGEYIVKDLFAEGVDLNFTINEDNSITVPIQEAYVDATYGQASVEGGAGSKVSPCTGEVILVLEHTVSAGTFGEITELFTKGTGSAEEPGDGTEGDGSETEGDGSAE